MNKKFIQFILIFLSLHYTLSNTCEALIKSTPSEAALIEEIEKEMHIIKNESNRCIETLLRSGNFKALETLLNELNKRGIKFRETLSVAINNIQKRLEDLHNKFRFDENDFQRVQPAFQWAQSMDTIFIEIKFAHRHDSPGCLEIKNESVEIYKSLVIFSGYCVLGDIPIKFELNLDLWQEINKEESTHGFGSVGRYQLTLRKKQTGMYWDKLLRDGVDLPQNMKVWFEMKSKFEDQIQHYEDDDENLEFDKKVEEIKKEAKEERKRKRKERKDRKNDEKINEEKLNEEKLNDENFDEKSENYDLPDKEL